MTKESQSICLLLWRDKGIPMGLIDISCARDSPLKADVTPSLYYLFFSWTLHNTDLHFHILQLLQSYRDGVWNSVFHDVTSL